MKRKRHSPEQVVRKLREADADLAAGRTVEEACKKLGVTTNTYYRLRANRNRPRAAYVELAPLPASAQFLNVIESVFTGMARAIIHNSNYGSVDEAMAAIDRYFAERNEHFQTYPKRAGKKIWGYERVPCEFSEAQNCKDPKRR